jgi:hypothetical protein
MNSDGLWLNAVLILVMTLIVPFSNADPIALGTCMTLSLQILPRYVKNLRRFLECIFVSGEVAENRSAKLPYIYRLYKIETLLLGRVCFEDVLTLNSRVQIHAVRWLPCFSHQWVHGSRSYVSLTVNGFELGKVTQENRLLGSTMH